MPEKKLIRKVYLAKSESSEDDNTAIAVISTDIVDRDKEVLLPKGAHFEGFLKNPVVLWAHDYKGTPIGNCKKGGWIKRGRKYIKAKWEWAPTEKAQEIRQLWEGGFLNAVSVGFLPAEDGSHSPTPDEIKKHPEWAEARRIYDDWELLEFSVVPVPANSDALAAAIKTKALSISKETQDELGLEDEETFYTDTPTDTTTDMDTNTCEPVKKQIKLAEPIKLSSPISLKRSIDKTDMVEKIVKKIKGKIY